MGKYQVPSGYKTKWVNFSVYSHNNKKGSTVTFKDTLMEARIFKVKKINLKKISYESKNVNNYNPANT